MACQLERLLRAHVLTAAQAFAGPWTDSWPGFGGLMAYELVRLSWAHRLWWAYGLRASQVCGGPVACQLARLWWTQGWSHSSTLSPRKAAARRTVAHLLSLFLFLKKSFCCISPKFIERALLGTRCRVFIRILEMTFLFREVVLIKRFCSEYDLVRR
jgi:hypothetical protein